MTDEDQDAAIGRIIRRFSDAKTRRAALMSEALSIADYLNIASEQLRNLNLVDVFWDGRPGSEEPTNPRKTLRPYANVERVQSLLDELEQVSKHIRETRQLLKDAGLHGVE